MVRVIASLVGFAFLLTLPAFALKGPRLPSTAKKLTAEEIIKLYDGRTISFNNFTLNKPLTGSFTLNYKNKLISGSYVFGTEKGTFKGAIRLSDDKFCSKVRKGKEVCAAIYKDGPNIYEVNSMGKVTSQNQVVR